MRVMPRRKLPYKACTKCKMLVDDKTEVCPNCGKREFSYEWDGLIIIVKPENSEVARLMGISKEGLYAIKVR